MPRRIRDRLHSRRVASSAPATFDIASTLNDAERAAIDESRSFTMVSDERLVANMDAVRYAVARGIPGAIVECGVWRGGSMLVMIRTLQAIGSTDREVYLFDTFEGMTAPTEHDTSRFAEPAEQTWEASAKTGTRAWETMFGADVFDVDSVRSLIASTGYPAARVHIVQGMVEDTIPAEAPAAIAVLRLDTDWYESTRHELKHLYPRLSTGGVLVLDDYGHWDGARRAVDEYLAASTPILLSRVDYTARIAIKH